MVNKTWKFWIVYSFIILLWRNWSLIGNHKKCSCHIMTTTTILDYSCTNSEGYLLPDVFENFFTRFSEAHGYNIRNASTQQIYVGVQGPTRGQKTLSPCGAHIWNYTFHDIDPNFAFGTFEKHIQRLFLNSEDDLLTWFLNTLKCFHINGNYTVSCTYVYPRVCMYTYKSMLCMYVFMSIQSSSILYWCYLLIYFFFVLHS